jgi:hypothetical protein
MRAAISAWWHACSREHESLAAEKCTRVDFWIRLMGDSFLGKKILFGVALPFHALFKVDKASGFRQCEQRHGSLLLSSRDTAVGLP